MHVHNDNEFNERQVLLMRQLLKEIVQTKFEAVHGADLTQYATCQPIFSGMNQSPRPAGY